MRRFGGPLALLTLVAALAAAPAWAAPVNDDFGDATAVALPSTSTQSTVGATVESGEPLPCFSGSTVWFSYAAGSTTVVTVDTFGSAFDTTLAVYVGSSLSTLDLVDCQDDFASPSIRQSAVNVAVDSGTTYWIQAGGFFGAQGSLTLNVSATPSVPANDRFAAAAPLSSPTIFDITGTTGASREAGEPVCSLSTRNTVWFSFTPGITRPVVITTTGSAFDTVLAVYTGPALGALTTVACNNDAAPLVQPSLVALLGTAGTTYWIQAGGFFNSFGTLRLSLA